MGLLLPAASAFVLAASSCCLAAAGPGGEKASSAGWAPLPPDHRALRDRFDFLGPVLRIHRPGRAGRQVAVRPRRLAHRDSFIRNASKDILILDIQKFPEELSGDFAPESTLGGEGLAVTYLATDRVTGKKVAVKVLKESEEGGWLTPKHAADHRYKALVRDTINECAKAQRIHLNDVLDAEGAKHVAQCIKDGIQSALSGDPSQENVPLFIAMEYAGDDALDWWQATVDGTKLQKTYVSWYLRSMSRQMMLGLRLLTHKDATQRWVHHNLKPQNMAVMQRTPFDAPTLTITGLADALSDEEPLTGKAVCTPIYQPPEWAGLSSAVGYSLPVHSFDASSAALSMLGLAGSPRVNGATTSMPLFYGVAWQLGFARAMRMDTLVGIAECIRELNGYRIKESRGHSSDDVARWAQTYATCVQRADISRYMAAEVEAAFAKVRGAPDEQSRIVELASLISCNAASPSEPPANLRLTIQIVTEWVQTGFDKVLMDMMALDPEKRPAPEQVLQAKWLQEGYASPKVPDSDVELVCPSVEDQTYWGMLRNIWIPVCAVHSAGAFALLVGVAAAGCHMMGNVPSPAFTAVMAGMFVFSSAVASSLWISSWACAALVCASLVLASALCLTGFRCAQNRDDPVTKQAWSMALLGAGGFSLVLFCTIRWLSGPVVDMTAFIMAHHQDIPGEDLFHQHLIVEVMDRKLWGLGHWENTGMIAWASCLPAWGGLVTVAFGLWRENVHGRRAAITRQVVGTEMPTASERSSVPRSSDPGIMA